MQSPVSMKPALMNGKKKPVITREASMKTTPNSAATVLYGKKGD
jgi:hypothetical protein